MIFIEYFLWKSLPTAKDSIVREGIDHSAKLNNYDKNGKFLQNSDLTI
jgi:hypothetical protein